MDGSFAYFVNETRKIVVTKPNLILFEKINEVFLYCGFYAHHRRIRDLLISLNHLQHPRKDASESLLDKHQIRNRFKYVHLSVCLSVCPCQVRVKLSPDRKNAAIGLKFSTNFGRSCTQIGVEIEPRGHGHSNA